MTDYTDGFTPEKYRELKTLYDQAVSDGKGDKEIFIFDNQEVLVGFAKYLLEYLREKHKEELR